MSNKPDPFSNSTNIKTIQIVDHLNLPVMQKHHIRILAHCLIILQTISLTDMSPQDEANYLRKWCNDQSQKFNDQKFNDLLYDQLTSATRKLKTFAESIGKDIRELDIDDLVLLVKENEI